MKTTFRLLLAALFLIGGTAHFLRPAAYLPIMPPRLPWPLALIYLSGAAEILGGLGLLPSATRRFAGWGLVLLLIAIFPANLYMLIARTPVLGRPIPLWLLWLRLPLQAVLIAWAIWVSKPPRAAGAPLGH